MPLLYPRTKLPQQRSDAMRQDDHPDVKTYRAKHAAAQAADEAYSAAIVAAGYKSRWDYDHKFIRAPSPLRDAYDAKVAADIDAQKWFRISFKVCHPDTESTS